VTALVRYVLADAVRGHRWVAPLLLFVAAEGILCATAGDVLPTYAGVAVVMLFVSIWITVSFANAEDPMQFRVTAAGAGGAVKARLAKLLAALFAGVLLGSLGLIPPAALTSTPPTAWDVASGFLAVVATCAGGVAIGAMCVRPIIWKTSWAVLCGVAGGLVTLLVPHCPPTRQILTLFGSATAMTRPTGLLLAVVAESLLLAVVLVLTSLQLAWRRS
jgi:hypothetical protein